MEDKLHGMTLHAICASDFWFEKLPLQEQLYVYALAQRAAAQMVVMNLMGDRRRGLDQFPEAWAHVKNPPLKRIEDDPTP